MKTTRILWSGLTGKVGREAERVARDMDDVTIVAGLSRLPYTDGTIIITGARQEKDGSHALEAVTTYLPKWYQYDGISMMNKPRPDSEGYDVLVDFSHADCFERVVELAVRMCIPLISGTSGLTDRQMAMLYDATYRIPVFRGGNFRFKVKRLIDEAVKLAMTTPGNLTLYENFYEGKSLPSETSEVMRRRIREATGKTIAVHSSATLDKTDLPCDWKIGDLRCHTVGFEELVHDVLEIAKVMAKKPVKKGEFYDLDELWDDLVSWAL